MSRTDNRAATVRRPDLPTGTGTGSDTVRRTVRHERNGNRPPCRPDLPDTSAQPFPARRSLYPLPFALWRSRSAATVCRTVCHEPDGNRPPLRSCAPDGSRPSRSAAAFLCPAPCVPWRSCLSGNRPAFRLAVPICGQLRTRCAVPDLAGRSAAPRVTVRRGNGAGDLRTGAGVPACPCSIVNYPVLIHAKSRTARAIHSP